MRQRPEQNPNNMPGKEALMRDIKQAVGISRQESEGERIIREHQEIKMAAIQLVEEVVRQYMSGESRTLKAVEELFFELTRRISQLNERFGKQRNDNDDELRGGPIHEVNLPADGRFVPLQLHQTYRGRISLMTSDEELLRRIMKG